jgi:2-polyprenyl-3-methyl-5-hydroxy-6-metoxy-1,4-benzoquinol methylase
VLTIDLRETLQGHALWSEPWDLVLAIDILEHFVESEGVALLTRIKESLSPRGLAIVSTPGNWNPQGAAFGNELERHRSFWSMPRLSEWGIARRVGSQVILIMRGE